MDETPALSLIKKIQSGQVDGKLISKEDRQRCVEVLYLEGYGVSELAEILGKSEKTIRRDLEDIRKANALTPDPVLAKEFIGEMVQSARIKQGRLERIAKSKDASAAEKAQAEYLSWRVCKEMVEKLQSLGYLPSRPTEIIGDITHHTDGGDTPVKSFDEITAIIVELQAIAEKTGKFDPETIKEIDSLNAELDRAKLTQKAIELKRKQEGIGRDEDQS